MKKNLLSASNNAGFTIIEVLFVLAIAGVIMLLVFQAIPALERSSRNNQRKQDIATILRAVSQYELRDSGSFPADCNGTPNACTDQLAANSNDYFLYYVKSKLTFYADGGSSADNIILKSQLPSATPIPNPVIDTGKVYIYNYQKCSTSGGGSTFGGAGFNDVVALYALETGNGMSISQCEQL